MNWSVPSSWHCNRNPQQSSTVINSCWKGSALILSSTLWIGTQHNGTIMQGSLLYWLQCHMPTLKTSWLNDGPCGISSQTFIFYFIVPFFFYRKFLGALLFLAGDSCRMEMFWPPIIDSETKSIQAQALTKHLFHMVKQNILMSLCPTSKLSLFHTWTREKNTLNNNHVLHFRM